MNAWPRTNVFTYSNCTVCILLYFLTFNHSQTGFFVCVCVEARRTKFSWHFTQHRLARLLTWHSGGVYSLKQKKTTNTMTMISQMQARSHTASSLRLITKQKKSKLLHSTLEAVSCLFARQYFLPMTMNNGTWLFETLDTGVPKLEAQHESHGYRLIGQRVSAHNISVSGKYSIQKLFAFYVWRFVEEPVYPLYCVECGGTWWLSICCV